MNAQVHNLDLRIFCCPKIMVVVAFLIKDSNNNDLEVCMEEEKIKTRWVSLPSKNYCLQWVCP